MKKIYTIILLFIISSICNAATQELIMSMDDRYTVQDTEDWAVTVGRYLSLRYADVKVLPKQTKKSFNLMLYFKCDTKDLAQFDTPKKMKKAVVSSSKKYLGGIVEKEIKVEEIKNKGWYGFKTQFTDASLVDKKTIPDDEYLYMIRGMIRLSEKSALGFSLMTNAPDSTETAEVMKYIYSFAKERKE
ncbi:hypothetical protein [Ereboglobus luteus]|uniref:Uncharacterized protein n=1 Tax=Ereboglobus luteus TaxID=1796921 RepID=A0A2U8E1R5_9BACT|nr:hypothetical protein [Ereboglobus luteus]AWI08726.1 hypothetical protein CKA38_05175 [Ereboglobus luteus]